MTVMCSWGPTREGPIRLLDMHFFAGVTCRPTAGAGR
mgnify:FL=1